MTRRGKQIVARARACIGVRFRPQGRDPRLGLDCIGLAAAATGVRNVPCDYRLRSQGQGVEDALAKLGFEQVNPTATSPGDLWLLDASPMQAHLGVFTGSGLVHADAGERKVVERPLPLPWPARSIWRAGEAVTPGPACRRAG